MQKIVLEVEDNVYDKVIFLLKALEKNGVKIDKIEEDYNFWNEKEIKQIGKIGFNSKSFDDNEDYSKW